MLVNSQKILLLKSSDGKTPVYQKLFSSRMTEADWKLVVDANNFKTEGSPTSDQITGYDDNNHTDIQAMYDFVCEVVGPSLSNQTLSNTVDMLLNVEKTFINNRSKSNIVTSMTDFFLYYEMMRWIGDVSMQKDITLPNVTLYHLKKQIIGRKVIDKVQDNDFDAALRVLHYFNEQFLETIRGVMGENFSAFKDKLRSVNGFAAEIMESDVTQQINILGNDADLYAEAYRNLLEISLQMNNIPPSVPDRSQRPPLSQHTQEIQSAQRRQLPPIPEISPMPQSVAQPSQHKPPRPPRTNKPELVTAKLSEASLRSTLVIPTEDKAVEQFRRRSNSASVAEHSNVHKPDRPPRPPRTNNAELVTAKLAESTLRSTFVIPTVDEAVTSSHRRSNSDSVVISSNIQSVKSDHKKLLNNTHELLLTKSVDGITPIYQKIIDNQMTEADWKIIIFNRKGFLRKGLAGYCDVPIRVGRYTEEEYASSEAVYDFVFETVGPCMSDKALFEAVHTIVSLEAKLQDSGNGFRNSSVGKMFLVYELVRHITRNLSPIDANCGLPQITLYHLVTAILPEATLGGQKILRDDNVNRSSDIKNYVCFNFINFAKLFCNVQVVKNIEKAPLSNWSSLVDNFMDSFDAKLVSNIDARENKTACENLLLAVSEYTFELDSSDKNSNSVYISPPTSAQVNIMSAREVTKLNDVFRSTFKQFEEKGKKLDDDDKLAILNMLKTHIETLKAKDPTLTVINVNQVLYALRKLLHSESAEVVETVRGCMVDLMTAKNGLVDYHKKSLPTVPVFSKFSENAKRIFTFWTKQGPSDISNERITAKDVEASVNMVTTLVEKLNVGSNNDQTKISILEMLNAALEKYLQLDPNLTRVDTNKLTWKLSNLANIENNADTKANIYSCLNKVLEAESALVDYYNEAINNPKFVLTV